ncbi:hypothetical protein IGB31_00080 [Pseudomonas putida]|nr:hypothetical protein IGB31_14145 [Pseudomonas putida]QOH70880.1 hypothetical protein IGB31_00080 [Pseudomonas putida]
MNEKKSCLNKANKFVKDIKRKSLGREDFLNMYMLGAYIELYLEGFEVISVKDTETRFSSCYLHIAKDKQEFILSEQVSQAFVSCLRYVEGCQDKLNSTSAKLLMSCFDAESVLRDFISLYESIESFHTKDQIRERLASRVDQFLNDLQQAYEAKLKLRSNAILYAIEKLAFEL